MPFMRGAAPVRRTLKYLEAGKISLRSQIQACVFHVNNKTERSKGTKDFIFWKYAQLQYANPSVQLVQESDIFPNPYIRAFLADGHEVLVDLDYHTMDEVEQRIKHVFGKTETVLQREAMEAEIGQSPANFGSTSQRHCICEVQGQQPCPATVETPMYLKGSWRHMRNTD